MLAVEFWIGGAEGISEAFAGDAVANQRGELVGVVELSEGCEDLGVRVSQGGGENDVVFAGHGVYLTKCKREPLTGGSGLNSAALGDELKHGGGGCFALFSIVYS